MAEPVVAAVPPDDLDRPTACADWTCAPSSATSSPPSGRPTGSAGERGRRAGIARLERWDRWAPTFAAAAHKARAAWVDEAAPPTEVRVPWGPSRPWSP